MFPETLSAEIIGHVFGGSELEPPTEWWAQLHYGAPGPTGAQNTWEDAGRLACVWGAFGDGWAANTADLLWEFLPNPGELTTISHCTIWSAEVGGKCLQVCDLQQILGNAPVVAASESLLIEAGTLLVQWAI